MCNRDSLNSVGTDKLSYLLCVAVVRDRSVH